MKIRPTFIEQYNLNLVSWMRRLIRSTQNNQNIVTIIKQYNLRLILKMNQQFDQTQNKNNYC